jgi:AI-2 transport protein TqsA
VTPSAPPPPVLAPRPWRDRAALATVATYLVIAATGWYLLKELAPVLRPLALAAFLAYVILPAHARLARRVPGAVASLALAAAVLAVAYGLGVVAYRSVVELAAEAPRYAARGEALLDDVRTAVAGWPVVGGLAAAAGPDLADPDRLARAAAAVANVTADILSETLIVAVYLLFVVLEAHHFPAHVRASFSPARADQLLGVVGSVSAAVGGYLKVKVLASLMLAVPAGCVLAAFGVKFPVLWGVLTFLLNFVPYLGSAVSCTLPILLAWVQLDPGWRPAAVTVLLVADHLGSAYVVEPALTGRAVGLSPLVVVLALGFWGLCWGAAGLLLAVPLTVVGRIVLAALPPTRPLARLMAEDAGEART